MLFFVKVEYSKTKSITVAHTTTARHHNVADTASYTTVHYNGQTQLQTASGSSVVVAAAATAIALRNDV